MKTVDVLVDVGASNYPKGNPHARRVTPNTQVYLFEPLESYFTELKNKFGNKENFHLYQLALSNTTGEADFYETVKANCSSLREPNSSNEVVSTRDGIKNFNKTTVKVDTMLNVLGHLDRIDSLKLDTQGTEYEVLLGAGDLLYRTKTIICEVIHTEWYLGQKLGHEVRKFLESKGFELTNRRDSDKIRHSDYTFENTNLD